MSNEVYLIQDVEGPTGPRRITIDVSPNSVLSFDSDGNPVASGAGTAVTTAISTHNSSPIAHGLIAGTAYTDTAITLVAGDAGKVITATNADAITVTLPVDSVIPVGSHGIIVQGGAGAVTAEGDDGVTLTVATGADATGGAGEALKWYKIAADTYLIA